MAAKGQKGATCGSLIITVVITPPLMPVGVRGRLIPILMPIPVFTVPVAIGVSVVIMPMTVSVVRPAVPISLVMSAVAMAVSVAVMVIATRVVAEGEMHRARRLKNRRDDCRLKTTSTSKADLRCIAAGFS